MPHYLRCLVAVTDDAGEPPFEDDDADVELGSGGVLVSYFDDQGPVVLQGVETEPGRFALKARSRPRQAELVREGTRLEGRWWDARTGGSLRIELGEEQGDA